MRILTYNIQEGGGNRLELIAGVVRERAPDIVAIMEASDRSRATSLAENLGMDLVLGETKRGDSAPGAPRRAIRLILDAGYADCYRTLHPNEPGYTYLAHHPWLRLDYVFAAPAMAVRLQACDVATGGRSSEASDHLPVWAEFGR